jgi:hypothetical protein
MTAACFLPESHVASTNNRMIIAENKILFLDLDRVIG